MGYVFISYSSKEQAVAKKLSELMKQQDVDVWMDKYNIPSGSKYAGAIARAIKGCACFLLVLSNAAIDSIWVEKELERAINYRKPIVPVQIEDVVLSDAFELYISTDQITRINCIDQNDAGIQTVLKSILSYAGVSKKDASDRILENKSAQFYLSPRGAEEQKIMLKQGANLIGTDLRKASIIIRDNFVSGIHAVITILDDQIMIMDLNTINGSYLNGKKIQSNRETILSIGDVLTLGSKEYELCATVFDKC